MSPRDFLLRHRFFDLTISRFLLHHFFLQILQRNALRFGHHFPDKKQLEHHHQREKSEAGRLPEPAGEPREIARNERRRREP